MIEICGDFSSPSQLTGRVGGVGRCHSGDDDDESVDFLAYVDNSDDNDETALGIIDDSELLCLVPMEELN